MRQQVQLRSGSYARAFMCQWYAHAFKSKDNKLFATDILLLTHFKQPHIILIYRHVFLYTAHDILSHFPTIPFVFSAFEVFYRFQSIKRTVLNTRSIALHAFSFDNIRSISGGCHFSVTAALVVVVAVLMMVVDDIYCWCCCCHFTQCEYNSLLLIWMNGNNSGTKKKLFPFTHLPNISKGIHEV